MMAPGIGNDENRLEMSHGYVFFFSVFINFTNRYLQPATMMPPIPTLPQTPTGLFQWHWYQQPQRPTPSLYHHSQWTPNSPQRPWNGPMNVQAPQWRWGEARDNKSWASGTTFLSAISTMGHETAPNIFIICTLVIWNTRDLKNIQSFFFWHFSISTQPSMTHQDPYHQHPTWSTPGQSNLQVPTTTNPCQTASIWPRMQTRSKISDWKSIMKNWIMS